MSTLFFVIPSRIDFLYSIKSDDEQDEETEEEGKVVLLLEYYEFNPGLKTELMVRLFL